MKRPTWRALHRHTSSARLGQAVALMLIVDLERLGYQLEGESMEQEHEGDGLGEDT